MPHDSAAREELSEAIKIIGLELEANQIHRLLGHLELLAKWSRTYNLTAIREPSEMLRQHLLDSLAVVPALRRQFAGQTPQKILDVGSGAGYPGLPLAITMPGSQVVCIDSVGKKVGFIRQVIAELGLLNVSAEHSRVETLPSLNADLITSRAFASLEDFTALTRRHLAPNGLWMAMKGKIPADEIARLPAEIDVFHVEQLVVPGLGSERCIVWMRPKESSRL